MSQGGGEGLQGGGETGRGEGEMDLHDAIREAVEKMFGEMHSRNVEDLEVI